MEFKDRIKEVRKEKKIKQSEIAKAISIVPATYSSWETGKTNPDFKCLVKLADYFQVTTDYLLGREDYGTGLIEIKQEPTEWERKIRDGRSQEEVREITFICEAYIQSEETYKSKIVGYITRCLEEQGKLRY